MYYSRFIARFIALRAGLRRKGFHFLCLRGTTEAVP
jgi:hypothetical protein